MVGWYTRLVVKHFGDILLKIAKNFDGRMVLMVLRTPPTLPNRFVSKGKLHLEGLRVTAYSASALHPENESDSGRENSNRIGTIKALRNKTFLFALTADRTRASRVKGQRGIQWTTNAKLIRGVENHHYISDICTSKH